jgi:hypothetical protein
MAIVAQRAAAMRRRATAVTFAGGTGVSLFIGIATIGLIGWVLFLVTLVITGIVWYNFTQVMKTRGYR